MSQLHDVFEKHVAIWHDRTHYPYQDKITRAILDGIVDTQNGIPVTIPIEISRQAGKTTSVVDIAEFLLVAYRHYFGRSIAIGIFAPQREQATTDFDRLKTQYAEISPLGFTTKAGVDSETKMPEKWNSKTIRVYNAGRFCGEVYIFPISKTSNPESKTLDVIIIEESQQVDDDKLKKSVWPMGAATNALRVMIGTAGTKLCEFKRQLDTNPRAIRIKLAEVFADRRRVYEQTKNPFHLRYEQFVTNEIKEYGADSDYIKTQYGGVWVIGAGQFCTVEQLENLIGDGQQILTHSELPAYVGIDTAKSPDQTVVTVLVDDEKDPMKSRLAGWLSLKGDNYEDQFEAITDWLAPKYEEYEEKGKKKQRLVAGFPEIRGIALDATGQGDFMPDKFERHTAYNLIRVPFTLQSKDVLYKNLLQVIQNGLTSIPEVRSDRDFTLWLTECVNLEKQWKGRFMSVHHPDDSNAHDDYPDSWALAEHAKTESVTNEPRLRVI